MKKILQHNLEKSNNAPRINPFPPNVYICYRIVKILIKKIRDHEKISYERRAYESVDDRSLSWAISQKTDGIKVLGCNGLMQVLDINLKCFYLLKCSNNI